MLACKEVVWEEEGEEEVLEEVLLKIFKEGVSKLIR
jgi:hypothetical protein